MGVKVSLRECHENVTIAARAESGLNVKVFKEIKPPLILQSTEVMLAAIKQWGI
ncbi:MAG: hypothetical protein IID17_02955 [Nitrospinae bacterium]|nr:hypothetical protein [Nitrospinota bacterium]